MAFQTMGAYAPADVNVDGLLPFGTAPHDTLSAASLNATLKGLQEAARRGMPAGVVSGGVCTAASLVVTVPSGTIYFARQVWEATSNTTISVPDAATSYIWGCADGELRYTSSETSYPTDYDGTTACLLTKAVATGGAATVDNNFQRKARVYDPATQTVTERGIAGGYASISVAGSGGVTLSRAQSANRILAFTGTLTGARTVTIPVAPAGRDWVLINDTSGAYSLTVLVSGGAGIEIPQGMARFGVCNGTDLLPIQAVAAPGGALPALPDLAAASDAPSSYSESWEQAVRDDMTELHTAIEDIRSLLETHGLT